MKHLVYILLLVFICSCGEKMINKPANLLSKDKMTAILYDLAILHSAKNTNGRILDEANIEVMSYIYEKHGIDSIQFVESDTYYAAIPQEYQDIYKSVEIRLAALKDKMDNAARKKLDSTRRKSLAKDSANIQKKLKK